VAVLRFGALGDVVLTAPALEALHRAWPQARVVFAVKERFAPLVSHNPHVHEVVGLRDDEGIVAFASRLRDKGPGAILDLHGNLRSRLVRALLPTVPTVAWHKRDLGDTLAVKLALRPYRSSVRFADRYHAAVEELVGEARPRGALRYFLGPGETERADAELRAAGVDLSRPLLGLSPGANWETKRWPAERFAGLARRALAQGIQVAVQGSDEEKDLCARVVEGAPGAADLAGRFDLATLGGFIARCAAFVANDSGPMHIARALGVPTLAVFGSTDPGMFDFTGHAALFAGVECSPCSFFGRAECPKGHFRCMLDLTEEHAWRALEPLFKGGPRAPVCA
jgi:lipopolysaccharide heptosyltransferase II